MSLCAYVEMAIKDRSEKDYEMVVHQFPRRTTQRGSETLGIEIAEQK